MLLTNHTLTGAAIAIALKQPALVAPVALASHFVLDSTPHFWLKQYNFLHGTGRVMAATDCFVALSTAMILVIALPTHFWILTLGIFMATLPDLLYIPRYLMKIKFWPRLFAFHGWLQRHKWSETPYGIVTEMIWATLMIGFLAR